MDPDFTAKTLFGAGGTLRAEQGSLAVAGIYGGGAWLLPGWRRKKRTPCHG